MSTVLELSMKPYPGCGGPPETETPRRLRAVKPEAEENAMKHRGSINLFSYQKQVVDEPPPAVRCGTDEAKDILIQHRCGSVAGLMSNTGTPRREPAPAPRVKPEAEEISAGHQGRGTASALSTFEHPRSARPAVRVKPEAEETAELHQGNRMERLVHSPAKIANTPRQGARVKEEGGDNAELDKGKRMAQNLQEYAQGGASSRLPPRVKDEAGDNAELDKGGRMKTMFHGYGCQPLSARGAPRVKAEAEESAGLDKGMRMSRIMHESEGNKLQTSRPVARARTPLAKSIAKMNRGSIGQIFCAQGRRMVVPVPGQRSTSVVKMVPW